MFNLFKFFRKKQKSTLGIVLGSGGAKGLAHIPVLEFLEQKGIFADIIVGSSMGAVIAAVYGAGSLQAFKEDMNVLTKRGLLSLLDPVLPRSGLLEGKKVISYLGKYIPPDLEFDDLKVKLGIMATDFSSGKSVLFASGNVLEALRASISIPGVFVPMRYRSALLIDGGVANPLPVNIAKKMGASLTVAVNLHRNIAGQGIPHSMKSTGRDRDLVIDSRNIADDAGTGREGHGGREDEAEAGGLKELPSIIESIMQTIDIMEYINTMLMLKYNRPTVLVEPDVERFGTLGFVSAAEIMREGALAVEKMHASIVRKLKQKI